MSEWITMLQSTNATERAEAETSLRSFGTNVVPMLVTRLTHRDSIAVQNCKRLLFKLGVRLPHRYSEDFYHSQAFCGFRTLGPEARVAVPALERLLLDSRTRVEAAVVLRYVAPDIAQRVAVEWGRSTNRQMQVDRLRVLQEFAEPVAPTGKL